MLTLASDGVPLWLALTKLPLLQNIALPLHDCSLIAGQLVEFVTCPLPTQSIEVDLGALLLVVQLPAKGLYCKSLVH